MIKKKTKIPWVTDERWNSEKQLSGPVEKITSRRRKLLYPHPKFSLGLVPYRSFTLNIRRCSILKNSVLRLFMYVNRYAAVLMRSVNLEGEHLGEYDYIYFQ